MKPTAVGHRMTRVAIIKTEIGRSGEDNLNPSIIERLQEGGFR